jgi:hypothetical protein
MTDTSQAPAPPPPSSVVPGPLKPPPVTVGTTAIAAAAGAGIGDTILWIFDCFHSHVPGQWLVTPDRDLAMVWGAALVPVFHALGRWISKRSGGNGE